MKEYFSHDYNARNDPKVVALVHKHKSSGYGIFWATNEMMHEQGGELELDEININAIAKQVNEESAYIQQVIKDCISIFKLYTIDNQIITSNRVKRNLTRSLENKSLKSEIGRRGGIKSGESRRSKQNEAEVEPNEAKVEQTKQSIEKNSIEKESIENINTEFTCLDAEQYLLGNQQVFEKICISTYKGVDLAKRELHNYHLWLTKNDKYPTKNSIVCAGFETWLLNESNYKKKYNGSQELDIKNKKLFI